MKTSKAITYKALNDHFLHERNIYRDESKKEFYIDEEYLNHLVDVYIFNSDRALYEQLHNKRRKTRTLVWLGFVGLATELIRYSGEPNAEKYSATSDHCKKWLNEYGRGFDSLAEVAETVEQYRKEEIFSYR